MPAPTRTAAVPRTRSAKPTTANTISSAPAIHVPGDAYVSAAKPIAVTTDATPATAPSAIVAVRSVRGRRLIASGTPAATTMPSSASHGHGDGRRSRSISPEIRLRRPSTTTGTAHVPWVRSAGRLWTRASCQTTERRPGRRSHTGRAAVTSAPFFSTPALAAVGDAAFTATPRGSTRRNGSPR